MPRGSTWSSGWRGRPDSTSKRVVGVEGTSTGSAGSANPASSPSAASESRYAKRAASSSSAAVGVAVTLYFWIDLETGDGGSTSSDELFGDTDALVTVSWGLILTLVASISLAAASVVNFLRRGLDDTTPSLVDKAPTESAADTTVAETK